MSGPQPGFRLLSVFSGSHPDPPPPPVLFTHGRGDFFLFFPSFLTHPHWVGPGFRVGSGCGYYAHTSQTIRAELSRLAAAWSFPVPRCAVAEFEPLGVSDSAVPGVQSSYAHWAKPSSCSLAYLIKSRQSCCLGDTYKQTTDRLKCHWNYPHRTPSISFFFCSPGERRSRSTGNHERTRGRGRGELWLSGAHGARGAPKEEAGETEETAKSKSACVSLLFFWRRSAAGRRPVAARYLHTVWPRCGSLLLHTLYFARRVEVKLQQWAQGPVPRCIYVALLYETAQIA